jgi:hypothetical protein
VRAPPSQERPAQRPLVAFRVHPSATRRTAEGSDGTSPVRPGRRPWPRSRRRAGRRRRFSLVACWGARRRQSVTRRVARSSSSARRARWRSSSASSSWSTRAVTGPLSGGGHCSRPRAVQRRRWVRCLPRAIGSARDGWRRGDPPVVAPESTRESQSLRRAPVDGTPRSGATSRATGPWKSSDILLEPTQNPGSCP